MLKLTFVSKLGSENDDERFEVVLGIGRRDIGLFIDCSAEMTFGVDRCENDNLDGVFVRNRPKAVLEHATRQRSRD